MEESAAHRWYGGFLDTVQKHEAAAALRDAALSGALSAWTKALTGMVVSTFQGLGWHGAARSHRSNLLPVPREEYLALDILAFETGGDRRWRFPVAVFELENSPDDDRVAYSLWKVLCVRASLRVVFCYRRDAGDGAEMVHHLSDEVVRSMGIGERASVGGETLLVVGSRSEASSFPYGFFKEWGLDTNTGRFRRS